MVKLAKSTIRGRNIRKDNWEELGIPTWKLVRDAITEGKAHEALELLEYLHREHSIDLIHRVHKSLAYIGKSYGDEWVAKAIRWWGNVLKKERQATYSLDVEELIKRQAEILWSSFSGAGGRGWFSVTEDSKRFVISVLPCHINRLRQKMGLDLEVVKEPHVWTWNRANIPYYCAHCCIWWEIMPIEERGYPVIIHEYPEELDKPCYLIIYKKPELIPEEYFRRVGLEKDLRSRNMKASNQETQ